MIPPLQARSTRFLSEPLVEILDVLPDKWPERFPIYDAAEP
jgi:hypothetical protein